MYRSRFFLFTALVLVFCSPLTAETHRTKRKHPPIPSILAIDEYSAVPDAGQFEKRVLELTNQLRKKEGLCPLRLSPHLTDSARWLAQDMGEKHYFSHTDSFKRSIEPRLPSFGYAPYETLGENIAAGHLSPEMVVDAWLHSEKHRHNLLNSDYTEIGIGFALVRGSKFGTYWVQDFGSRADYFPVVINDGMGKTASREVRLYLHGQSWAQQMRLSSDGINWSGWEAFSSTRSWMLREGEKNQTVFVELKRGDKVLACQEQVELVAGGKRDGLAQTGGSETSGR